MKYVKPAIFCMITLLWMVTIFWFSAQPADKSSAMSSPFAEKAVDLLYSDFETMPAVEQTKLLDQWTHIVRKGAHFNEYALMGVLISMALAAVKSVRSSGRLFDSLRFKLSMSAFIIGSVYAATDELHQCFVPGRSGQFSDVFLDSMGVLTGVLILLFLVKIKAACRNNRQAGRIQRILTE